MTKSRKMHKTETVQKQKKKKNKNAYIRFSEAKG